MRLPDRLTRYNAPSSSMESSGSITYDYSGADEARARQDELSKLNIAKSEALYSDPLSALASAARIRDLRRMIGAIEPVRISRIEQSGRVSSDGGGFEGEDGDGLPPIGQPPFPRTPPARKPPAPKPAANHVLGVDKPVKQLDPNEPPKGIMS